MSPVMMYGMKLSGNRSMLNNVRLTKAVFGSRLFFSSIKMNVPKETTATTSGAHDHVNPDTVLNNDARMRFVISLARIFLIIFWNDTSQPMNLITF